jgi:hypothetical protein
VIGLKKVPIPVIEGQAWARSHTQDLIEAKELFDGLPDSRTRLSIWPTSVGKSSIDHAKVARNSLEDRIA